MINMNNIMSSIFKKNNKVLYISLIITIIGVFYISGRYDKNGEITSFGCKMHPKCINKEAFNDKIREERYLAINRSCQNYQDNFRIDKDIKFKNCLYYKFVQKTNKEYHLDKYNYRSISSKDLFEYENGYKNYKLHDNSYQYKTDVSP